MTHYMSALKYYFGDYVVEYLHKFQRNPSRRDLRGFYCRAKYMAREYCLRKGFSV